MFTNTDKWTVSKKKNKYMERHPSVNNNDTYRLSYTKLNTVNITDWIISE